MHGNSEDVQFGISVQRNRRKQCLENCFLIRCVFFGIAVLISILFISFRNTSIPKSSIYDYGISIDYSFRSDEYTICTVPPLTYILKLPEIGSYSVTHHALYSLRINKSLAPYYFNGAQKFYCCYAVESTDGSGISFMKDDNDTKDFSDKCKSFDGQVSFPIEDAILVVCTSSTSSPIDIRLAEYKNIHFLHLQEKGMKKNYESRVRKSMTLSNEMLNFLMIGFDGNANSNIMDKMPQTNQFLKENGFIKLEKFGKISSNVRSNELALISGVNLLVGQLLCHNGINISEKYCPFFNNEYRDLGYNQGKLIVQMPYYRPFFSNSPDNCRGPSFSINLLFQYILNYVQTQKSFLSRPSYWFSKSIRERDLDWYSNSVLKPKYFLSSSLYWLMNITDEQIKYTEYIDVQTLRNLNEIHQEGVFNNTLFIFVSFNDDRSINDELRKDTEENKSHVYLSLPEWFKRKYPRDIENLESNAKQLTSPYDVYLTVKDVIRKTSFKPWKEQFIPCNKCTSLFQVIENRTCNDAGIPLKFCPITSD